MKIKGKSYVVCNGCFKKFLRHDSRIKKNIFCSRKCYRIFLIGKPSNNKGKKSENTSKEKHWNWKGGRYLSKNGYIFIHCPNHHRSVFNKKYVPEHVLVVERKIDRFLKFYEDVHHINGNKLDNRPENLIVLTHNQHSTISGLNRKHKKGYKKNGINKFIGQNNILVANPNSTTKEKKCH